MTLALRSGLILSFFMLAGCGSSGGLNCGIDEVECDGICIPEISPTLSSIQANVFNGSCAVSSACHQGLSPAEMLDLSSVAVSQANLIDVPSVQDDTRLRVEPGNSLDSYLMNKLDGVNLANASTGLPSDQMPLTGALCEAKIEVVRAWIEAGAN